MSNNKHKSENKHIAERRGKLDAMRELGNAYPNDFRRNALAEELHRTYEAHADQPLRGEHVAVPVSGRIMAKRVSGQASLLNLPEWSGQVQSGLARARPGGSCPAAACPPPPTVSKPV